MPKKEKTKKRKKPTKEATGRLDLLDKFVEAWSAYKEAAEGWIRKQMSLMVPAVTMEERLTNARPFQIADKILKENNAIAPDLKKLHHEANEACIPILDVLFTPNEMQVIPEFEDHYFGGSNKWLKDARQTTTKMAERITNARNRLRFEASYYKGDLIPPEGWSDLNTLKHWAKVFDKDRKTVRSWFENAVVKARKVGSRWKVAKYELAESYKKRLPK